MDYKSMTDLQLYEYRNQASNDEIFRRHKKFIYKESHKFFNRIHGKVPLEDIIQDMASHFFEIIPKIDLKRIKNLENFNFVIYMPYFFLSFKTALLRKYRYELNRDQKTRYSQKALLYSTDNEEPIQVVDNRKTQNMMLFDYLKTKITKREYQIIFRFFVLKDKKKDIAKDLKMQPSLFTHYFQQTLRKVRNILLQEKFLLYN